MDGTKFQKESGMPYKEAFIGTRCQLCILRHIEYISICLYIFHLLLHNLMISHYISAKVQLVKRESTAVVSNSNPEKPTWHWADDILLIHSNKLMLKLH